MPNYTKILVRGTGWLLFASILAALLGYVLRVVLARNLSIEDYGLFYAVFALVGLLASFRGFGIGQALMKYIPEFKIKKDFSSIKKGIIYYFFVQLITYGLLLVGIFLLAERFALYYFKDIKAVQLLVVLGLAFLFAIFESLFHVLFLGYKKMNYYAFTHFFQMSLVVLITIILFYLGFGYLSPAYAYLFASILSGIVYFLLFSKLSPKTVKAKSSVDFKLFKKLTLFGFPLTISAVVASSVGYIDTLLITFFIGLKEVALYNVALPIAMMLRQFAKSVSLVLIPLSSEIYLQKKEVLIDGIKRVQKYLLIVVFPLSLGMVFFAPLIILLFFGENYIGATSTLRILSFSAVFYCVAYVNANILLGIGKSKINAKIMAGGSIFALILNLILIPFYGILGAGLSLFFASLLMFFVSFYYLKKIIKYNFPAILFVKLFVLGFLFLILCGALRKMPIINPWIEFVVIGLIGLIFYFVGLFLFRLISFEEVRDLLKRVA
jgi:O-antigen/teichoic acid export membrane protein